MCEIFLSLVFYEFYWPIPNLSNCIFLAFCFRHTFLRWLISSFPISPQFLITFLADMSASMTVHVTTHRRRIYGLDIRIGALDTILYLCD